MPSPDRVSLPSINEMFPEHMMASWYPPPDPVASSSAMSPPPPPPSSPGVKALARGLAALPPLVPPPPPPPLHNALRSPASPRSHAKPFDERPRPVFRVQIPEPAVYAHGYADPVGYRPRESGASSSGEEKKHCCPHCHKRFNRPSSLNIHVNTHTGAKPFQCPYPGCNRKFNVNSNMRRHWRNHVTSTRRRDAVARLVASPSTPSTPSSALPPLSDATTPLLAFSPAGSAYSLPSSLSSASSTHSAESRSPSPPPASPWPAGEEGLRHLAAIASSHSYQDAAPAHYDDRVGRVRSRSSPAPPAPVRCEEGRARARSCVLPGCVCRR